MTNEQILRRALERAKTDLEIANETEGFMLDCSYIDEALKATEPPKYNGQRTCAKCGIAYPIGQRHECVPSDPHATWPCPTSKIIREVK